MDTQIDYRKVYSEFTEKFATEGKDAVASTMVKLTDLYAKYNTDLSDVLNDYAIAYHSLHDSTDEATGKAITSSKAAILMEDTIVARDLRRARAHVGNIERMLNTLDQIKSL